MNQRELSVVLRELARSQQTPLCEQWTKEWHDDSTMDMLFDKFFRGQDFCIQNDYPSIDFIKKNFSKEELHRHHVYIDENVDVVANESGYYAFLGNCSGGLRIDGIVAATVYVRHSCNMYVLSKGGAKVSVFSCDNSRVECESDGFSLIKKYIKK